jgi:hypothetical protein
MHFYPASSRGIEALIATCLLVAVLSGADSDGSRPLIRNDVAHPFRDEFARRSEMISPTIPG